MQYPLKKRLKRAFFWPWNLFALATATGFAIFSGHYELFLPIIAISELTFLSTIGIHKRFQKVLRGEELLKKKKGSFFQQENISEKEINRIVNYINKEDLNRYYELKNSCVELIELKYNLDPNPQSVLRIKSANQKVKSVNKLLWLFLRHLFRKNLLENFLENVDSMQLEKELRISKERLEHCDKSNEKIFSLVNAKHRTIKERLENIKKSQENLEIIKLEIEKSEHKIKHLCEMGMSSKGNNDIIKEIRILSENLQYKEKHFDEINRDYFSDLNIPCKDEPKIINKEKNLN